MPAPALVLLIIIGVALVQAAIWIPVVRFRRRRAVELSAAVVTEVSASPNEKVLRGPAPARCRRGHNGARGVLVLTNRRLLFVGGMRIEISLADVRDVKSNTWFNGSYRDGLEWLIISAERSPEVAFILLDRDTAWPTVVRTALGPQGSN